MIIVDYFLVHPKFIQSCFKHVSRYCMHNAVRQTIPQINNSVSKKRIYVDHILYDFFCNFKSLPLVDSMLDLIKFGTATVSYLPDNIL